ncbi:hypothetical protein TNCV_4585101 [Trichonephila clavipes]|nr:hypothetical protein TNCV_4585101 [Trichonephila clavipes]
MSMFSREQGKKVLAYYRNYWRHYMKRSPCLPIQCIRQERNWGYKLGKGKDSSSLKVLFWNAGDLTIDKFIELKTVTSKESPDAIRIAEGGSSADNLRFFPLKGYKSYYLGRS